MCNVSCIIFGATNLKESDVKGKRILEVGSRNTSGSLRPLIEGLGPKEYVGIDICKGDGVDVICDAQDLTNMFGESAFDVVVSTELLEHVRDWRKVISNIKNVCKEGGIILITTRSRGFHYHADPGDFWRYETEDMESIFADCEILALEKDGSAPGIFIKLKKPRNFSEVKLTDYPLYSIVCERRVEEITDKDFRGLTWWKTVLKYRAKNFIGRAGGCLLDKL